MVSHYEKGEPQRYRQLKTYLNRWIYTFDKFRGTFGIDLTHKGNTTTRTFDCVFAWDRTRYWSELIKILARDLQKRIQESYWRFIWCICNCCMHSHSLFSSEHVLIIGYLIGHFRVPFFLCFTASLSAKPFLWKWLWFAWKWNCVQNSFSYERFRT